jgi:D-glycero-D-manno-heptose 1,7-bisphosphate phosphatase
MALLKAIFLDRDGVINKLIEEGEKLRSPRLIEEFEYNEGIFKFVTNIKALQYLPIVVSNQPEVKRGLAKREIVDLFHQKIKVDLGVEHFFICFHDEYDNCDCRKPKPGLILEAAHKLSINIQESYLVGDREKDMLAAQAAGCHGIMLSQRLNAELKCFDNFDNIFEFIIHADKSDLKSHIAF